MAQFVRIPPQGGEIFSVPESFVLTLEHKLWYLITMAAMHQSESALGRSSLLLRTSEPAAKHKLVLTLIIY